MFRFRDQCRYSMAVALLTLASAVGAAPPAEQFELFGNAEIVNAGKKNQFGALLISDVTQTDVDQFAGIAFEPRKPLTFADIDRLSATLSVDEGGYGGGSPRFSIGVDADDDGEADGNVFVYLGTPPNFDDPVSTNLEQTGNLIDSTDLRFDTSQVGGTFFDDYAGALELVGDADVVYVVFAVDAGWFFDDGVQSVLVTELRVDNAKFKVKKPKH